MSNYICEICNKEFGSTYALVGHKRMHGPSKGKFKLSEKSALKRTKEKQFRIDQYYQNPNNCPECNSIIEYDYKTLKTFCTSSCAAKFNNKHREVNWATVEWRERQARLSVNTKRKKKFSLKIKISSHDILGDFTKVKRCHCDYCSVVYYTKDRTKFCPNCSHLYSKGSIYRFRFNVFDYPDLFDLELIKKIGWHSFGGRFNYNPEGITRDHKVSVSYAVKNDCDPYYITHPMNCELMSFEQNNKKKGNCSITYEQLISLVEEFDKNP